jgi:hypothetical protein
MQTLATESTENTEMKTGMPEKATAPGTPVSSSVLSVSSVANPPHPAPTVIADMGHRLRCPVCGSTTSRETTGMSVTASCLECDWRRTVVRGGDGEAWIDHPPVDVTTAPDWKQEKAIQAKPRWNRIVTANRERGKERTDMPKQRTQPIGCMVDGCNNEAQARGLCHGHYWRWTRAGKPEDLAAWVGQQADQPLRGRRPQVDGDKPRRQAQPKPRQEATVADAVADAAGGAGHVCESSPFLRIALPAATKSLMVGVIGRQLTLADADGRVLQQVQIGGGS